MSMFCYQCEQAAKGTGCTNNGVCGKDPEISALQDLLIHAVKGISMYASRARQLGVKDREVDVFVIEALFTTVTNVNFDQERHLTILNRAAEIRDRAKELYITACASKGQTPEELSGPAAWTPASNLDDMIRQGEDVSLEKMVGTYGEDIGGLRSLILFGLKGTAAYADHALILGKEDDTVYGFFHDTMDLLSQTDVSLEDLLGTSLKVGEVNLTVMGLLDAAHTETYGHPEPTQVPITARQGKAILVSGHDLKDLDDLLKQTEGKGINIYTHGEMLPLHAYPELKKYSHLVGNYGGAWQDQRKEFDEFPGAILMTANCIQKPKDSYKSRLFTAGLVAWPGVAHISDGNYEPVINAALAAEGFTADEEEKNITVGFGHNAVMGVAGNVIDAVKSGKIKHFFLIGGCDGAKSGRNYYTDFAQAVPEDCVILTLACGKYRFNKFDFGAIDGIPRLLDIGQCNDAYSAIQIAVALANAFETDVNGLPLSMILSWYEQKAVCILLTLLHLGVKNIRLGPSLPAFVSPAALDILVDKFEIKPITTVEADLKNILG